MTCDRNVNILYGAFVTESDNDEVPVAGVAPDVLLREVVSRAGRGIGERIATWSREIGLVDYYARTVKHL